MDLEIEIYGLDGFTTALANVPAELTKNLLSAANKAALYGESIVKQHVPVWKGALMNSLQAQPAVASASVITATISTNLGYAPTMEEGRRPGSKMPPKGVMLAWMASKGIPPDREFVVRRAIAQHGVPGHFFMRAAFEKLADGTAERFFEDAIDQTLKTFGGS